MISFSRAPLWRRVLCMVSKKHASQRDAETRAALTYLIDHPEAPCMIDGAYIPNGYGLGYGSATRQEHGLLESLLGAPQ